MILFRPVGLNELRLIYDASMREFPPRLPDQPIFYPVTNEDYARKIASEWNTTSGTFAGYVTRFSVDDAYASKFERRIVGSREHEELWVPAEELAEFNRHIVGTIEVIGAYFGNAFRGIIPEVSALAGKDLNAQFVALEDAVARSTFDVAREAGVNHAAIFLNAFYWEKRGFLRDSISDARRDEVLSTLKALRTK